MVCTFFFQVRNTVRRTSRRVSVIQKICRYRENIQNGAQRTVVQTALSAIKIVAREAERSGPITLTLIIEDTCILKASHSAAGARQRDDCPRVEIVEQARLFGRTAKRNR